MASERSVKKVTELLDEIRKMGAVVEHEAKASAEDIARVEATLGFALPDEYREFVGELGGISIELVRTWFFYGIASAQPVTKFYATELDSFRDGAGADGPYYPKRFIVMMDEGDYSNAAAGWVYDADLDAFFPTDGGRWVDRDEADPCGYWGKLVEELTSVRDRIADPDDCLVSGMETAVNARRRLP